MTDKHCLSCDKTLPLLAFAKSGKLGGIQRYKSHCRECINSLMRVLRGPSTRAHFENVSKGERCPHGGGTRKFAWVGYRG